MVLRQYSGASGLSSAGLISAHINGQVGTGAARQPLSASCCTLCLARISPTEIHGVATAATGLSTKKSAARPDKLSRFNGIRFRALIDYAGGFIKREPPEPYKQTKNKSKRIAPTG